jgi:hypothetical protein
MSRLQKALNRLEIQLRDLIEGSAERIFPSTSMRSELAHQLVQAMHAKIITESDGSQSVPNLYTLTLPHPQALALQGNPQVLDELAASLEDYARQAGLHLYGKPMLKVISAPAGKGAEMHVLASFSPTNLGETAQLEVVSASETPTIPLGAFLIIKGERIVPLNRAVINIGRAATNDLIFEEIQVSREHAQLRAIRGRYVIFDLNSTGGTYVNGAEITQHELTPGDLISLADVLLIYGQEQPYHVEETQDLSDLNKSESNT